jgi:choloylglycine hydrolase
LTLDAFGQGSGLRGMPGDFTSPSRFIRAAVFITTALPADHSTQAVLDAFHVLNQFDIPLGAVRAVQNNKMYPEYTMTTTVKDPNTLKYYFKTYQDQAIKMLDLNAVDLNANHLTVINMNSPQPIINVTPSNNDGMSFSKS